MFVKVVLLLLAVFTACAGDPVPDSRNPHIVGGFVANIQDYPYTLSLRYRNSPTCGAAVVSSSYALSAAHCVDTPQHAQYSLLAGSSYIAAGQGTLHRAVWIVVHPMFNERTLDYDFALLKVSPEFKFGKLVQPVRLAVSTDVQEGWTAVVTGFGSLSSGGPSSRRLQAVKVPIVSQQSCKSAYLFRITDRMMCAGLPAGGADACQGDSGGPMVVDGALTGLVSWGQGCGLPNKPGVYSKVASVREWIDANSGGGAVLSSLLVLPLPAVVTLMYS